MTLRPLFQRPLFQRSLLAVALSAGLIGPASAA